MKTNNRKLISRKENHFKLYVKLPKRMLELQHVLEVTSFAINRACEIELDRQGLTTSQAGILRRLEIHGGSLKMKEIPGLILRQPHSVYTLIKRMTDQGLVEKIKETDKNDVTIVLTKKGRDKFYKCTGFSLEKVFSTLSAEEIVELIAYLERLKEEAKDLLGTNYISYFIE